MRETIERVIERWAAEGDARPGATEGELRAVEAALRITMPRALVALLRRSNGTESMDSVNLVHFWSTEEILEEARTSYDQTLSAGYLAFADYSIHVHAFAVQVSVDVPSPVIIDQGAHLPLARSFEDFLRLYLADSRKLYGWRAGEPAPDD